MMKWLRLHNKKIMAAIVLLAMFSFVGGSALYGLFATSADDVMLMKVHGHEYSLADLNAAQVDTEILNSLGVGWDSAGGKDFNVRHWLMLAADAEQNGIRVSEKEVRDWLEEREPMLLQMGGGSLADIRKRTGASLGTIRAAVARQMAIDKHFGRVATSAAPSEPQVRHYVEATEAKVQVVYAPLDAENFVDSAEPVTEAEAQEQFEKYKDVVAGEGEAGFGYKHPRRVKLQYAVAPISKIESQVEVTLDEVKNHWKLNEAKYTKLTVVEEPIPVDPAASQPATQPATRKTTKQVPKSFSEARPEIETELRKSKATRVAREAMKRLTEDLGRPWLALKSDTPGGYKPIPEEAKDPEQLKKAVADVEARLKVKLDYQETGLLTQEDIEADFMLKGAETPGDEDKPMTIGEYAFRTTPFFKPEQENDSALRLQHFQAPIVPLTIAERPRFDFRLRTMVQGEPSSLVIFRVIDARESESPASLAEVREKVEKDVRLKKAYARVEPIAKELCAVASRVGLEKALTYFDDLRTTRGVRSVKSPPAFSRMMRITNAEARQKALDANQPLLQYSTIDGIGKPEKFIDSVFEMAAPDWTPPVLDVQQTSAVQAATTQPAATPAPKVLCLDLPSEHSWVVVELKKHLPMRTDVYASEKKKTAFQAVASDRATAVRLAWFSPKAVEDRVEYVDLDESGEAVARQSFSAPQPPSFGY